MTAPGLIRPTDAAAPYSAGSQYYDATKFVPELYSKKVLRNFYITTVWNEIFNTDLTSRSLGL